MHGSRKRIWWAALLLVPSSVALGVREWRITAESSPAQLPQPLSLPQSDGMVKLPGGLLMMGSTDDQDVDAKPVHRVRLSPFWIDKTPVTNAQFKQFIDSTGYVTDAERTGSSLVFDYAQMAWREVVGVSWLHPNTPDDSLLAKEAYPVVHVSWQDAVSFAAWAGKRLPTEAEYEYAARGGWDDCTYAWGQEIIVDQQHMANGWQGRFPEQDHAEDGFRGLSPVRKFPPNRFGLYDMVGNVYCWCADWYAADTYGRSLVDNPQGPTVGDHRVRRGGSWLSTINYGGGLRVACRDHAPPSETTNHTGFRCVRDVR